MLVEISSRSDRFQPNQDAFTFASAFEEEVSIRDNHRLLGFPEGKHLVADRELQWSVSCRPLGYQPDSSFRSKHQSLVAAEIDNAFYDRRQAMRMYAVARPLDLYSFGPHRDAHGCAGFCTITVCDGKLFAFDADRPVAGGIQHHSVEKVCAA